MHGVCAEMLLQLPEQCKTKRSWNYLNPTCIGIYRKQQTYTAFEDFLVFKCWFADYIRGSCMVLLWLVDYNVSSFGTIKAKSTLRGTELPSPAQLQHAPSFFFNPFMLFNSATLIKNYSPKSCFIGHAALVVTSLGSLMSTSVRFF